MKTPNKKLIGLFTISGVLLFVAMMLLFLGDKLFVKKEDMVVLYFEESIKGLNVGSPVVLQGVEVGKVTQIDLLVDSDDSDNIFKIPVYVKFNANQILEKNKIPFRGHGYWVKVLVEKGLRGRLANQNLLTGQLVIELVFMPETPINLRGKEDDIEIPTVLSYLGEFSKDIQSLPIKEGFESFNRLMKQTSSLVKDVTKSLDSSKDTAADSMSHFNRTLRDIGDAAQAMRNLTDYLERHPESLLKGKGEN